MRSRDVARQLLRSAWILGCLFADVFVPHAGIFADVIGEQGDAIG